MKFTRYWQRLSAEEKRDLAAFVGSTPRYLGQIAHGHRKPSLALTLKLTGADCDILAADLRPDWFALSKVSHAR
jgi:transcriptional regulator with XRE-family HTH domain